MPKQPEPWIERTLREAAEAGEFDDLPGRGKPIGDIDLPYDADWWVRKWWERNRALDEASTLAADVQRRLPTVMAQRDEAAVRTGLEDLNRAIATRGAGLGLEELPIDEMLAGWRARRSGRHMR